MVLLPVPTVMVPPGRMPSVASEVLVVTRAELLPVAGEADALAVEPAEAADDVEPLGDDVVELPDGLRICCTRAVIWLLTRFNAV